MKLSTALQKFLPFGYLYLIVMGILKETIYYYQVGINIMSYSSLSDIMLSPVAELSVHWIMLLGVLFSIGVGVFYFQLMKRNNQKDWVQKAVGRKKGEPNIGEEAMVNEVLPMYFIKFGAVMLLCYFLGVGLGKGTFTSKRIKENNMKYKHSLTYNSGEKEEIYMVGNNSTYYFFVPKGSKNIKIAPVGTIKSIEYVDNKALK